MMSVFKKLITVLCFVLLSATATYAAEYGVDPELLDVLGINTAADDSAPVTRAQLAEYAVKTANTGVSCTDMTAKFSDVTDERYIPYINAAFDYGLMHGDGDGRFEPDEICTAEQMCAVFLRIAGYDSYAQKRGGYTAAAAGLDIFSGNAAAQITHGEAKKAICRLLDTKMPKIKYGERGVEITSEAGVTVLDEYFETKKYTGRIVGIDDVSVSGYSPAGVGSAVLLTDSGTREFSLPPDIQLLGYRVRAYAHRSGTGEEELICTVVIDGGVGELFVITGEVESVSKTLDSIEYATGGKRTKTARISDDAVFVYNGEKAYGVTKEDLELFNGNMKLVDADLNGVYDIVHIENYIPYIADSKNTRDITVTDRVTKKTVDADVFSSDYDITILKNGKHIDFLDINKWDVMLVADSKGEDGSIKRTIIISQDIVRGTVQRTDEDFIEADGNVFGIAAGIDVSELEIGRSYIFGLNLNGQICIYTREDVPEEAYVYIYKLYSDESVEDKVYADVLTEDNEYRTEYFAETFFLNDRKATYTMLREEMSPKGFFAPALALVKYDSDGNVKRIYTSAGITEPEANMPTGLYKNFESDSVMYKSAPYSFGAYWMIGPQSRVFEIYLNSGNTVNTRFTHASDRSAFRLADATYPNVRIYNSGTNHIAGAVVITYDQGAINFRDDSSTRQMAVVDRITEKVNAEGDVIKVLECAHLGGITEYEIYEGAADIGALKRGDCIYGNFSNDNMFYGYEMRFSLEKDERNSQLSNASAIMFGDVQYTSAAIVGNVNSTRGGILGTVSEVTPIGQFYAVTLKCDGSDDTYVYMTDANTFVYDCTGRGNIPEVSSAGNINAGNRIFLANRYGYARDILVFEKN